MWKEQIDNSNGWLVSQQGNSSIFQSYPHLPYSALVLVLTASNTFSKSDALKA